MAEFDRIDTRNKIIDLVAEKLNIDKATIMDESTFQALGADSLDIVELIMNLEDRFGIEIKDEDAERLQTLADLINYVQERRKK